LPKEEDAKHGHVWMDAIAVARQIVAGELGVIEGRRELSSMRWEFGAEMTELFLPFVAIDNETDDLPIGAVRELWQGRISAKRSRDSSV
jgi:hypothetical protein